MKGITIQVGKNGVQSRFESWTKGEQRVIDSLRGVLLLGILLGVMWLGIQMSNLFGMGTVGILGTFLLIRVGKPGVKVVRWFLSRRKVEPKGQPKQQPKPVQPNQNPNKPFNQNGNGQKPQGK